MQPLVKNAFPEIIDAIKVQNGFLGFSNLNNSYNQNNIITIMPDRIMVIYKDYIAIDNFDKNYSFFECNLNQQTNILLFQVFKIENPGNVFARYLPNFSYNLCNYMELINNSETLTYNNFYKQIELDFLEIALLINRLLEIYDIQYTSSSDLFSLQQLSKYLSSEKINEIQNSKNQFLLSHTKPFEDVSSALNKKAKKVIAEYVQKENINIEKTVLPPNINMISE